MNTTIKFVLAFVLTLTATLSVGGARADVGALDHLTCRKVKATDRIDAYIAVLDDMLAQHQCLLKRGKAKKLCIPGEEWVLGIEIRVNGISSSPIVLDPAPQELTQKGYLCYKVKCAKPNPARVDMDLVDEFVERSVANGNPVTVYRQVIEICKPVEVPAP